MSYMRNLKDALQKQVKKYSLKLQNIIYTNEKYINETLITLNKFKTTSI